MSQLLAAVFQFSNDSLIFPFRASFFLELISPVFSLVKDIVSLYHHLPR